MTLVIAVDFDGTIVTHAYPEIGKVIPGALDWLKRFKAEGAKLILWTMRSGDDLEAAIEYLLSNGVEVDAANENLEDQSHWTTSPKILADIYIDDRNAACPVIQPINEPAQVNWQLVGPNVILKLKKGSNPWQASSPHQKTSPVGNVNSTTSSSNSAPSSKSPTPPLGANGTTTETSSPESSTVERSK